MWILRIVDDGHSGQVFRILPGGVRTLGRSPGADFIVDAPLVSRVHCRITAQANGDLEVTDLESTNGTFLNGRRIDTARLASGDRIGIGRLEIMVIRESDWPSGPERP